MTGAFNNELEEKVFKVGDRVKDSKGKKGDIVEVYAVVRYETPISTIKDFVNLDQLSHYQGPTDEANAWERVTMDIVAEVVKRLSYHTDLDEYDRRSMRHDAYVVLGSVMRVDEEVKERVRGIIERAEKRYSQH